jgi:toxin-antitoxin system PIN domain toxin
VRLVDANLLVYAFASSMPQHERVRTWLDGVLSDIPRVGLPWPSLLAFVRLVSNPRVFERPVSIADAWDQVLSWFENQSVWVPLPTLRHSEVLSSLLSQPGLDANHIPDAHLAALAIEHGLVVSTTDNDFQKFAGIETENPLRAPKGPGPSAAPPPR